MEKNITMTVGGAENKNFGMADLLKGMREWLAMPVVLLSRYYSSVLEREVTVRQTRRLVEAQLAFLSSVIPADVPIAMRLAAVAWLVSACLRCKEAMK